MTDKDLYELCVSSGFAEASMWWPSITTGKNMHWLEYTSDAKWRWASRVLPAVECHPYDARARILAGLVEWGTSGDRKIGLIAIHPEIHVAHILTGKKRRTTVGMGENSTTALLDCFRQWRANQ